MPDKIQIVLDADVIMVRDISRSLTCLHLATAACV